MVNLFIIRKSFLLLILFISIRISCSSDIPEKKQYQVDHHHPPKSIVDLKGETILLVHSYHREYPWVASISDGVRSTIEGTELKLEIFYMDTKRKTDTAWKVRAGELAVRKVEELNPVIVITADDNAQQYFGTKYINSSLPIVFCGVNADPSKYGYPCSNITGIIERPHLDRCLAFIQQIRPMRKIAIISCDDETSIGAIGFMKEEFYDVDIAEYSLVSYFDDWKKEVLRLNGTVDAIGIYMYHTIKRRGHIESLDPKIVMDWTRKNAIIPTIGFFEFGVQDGLLLGVVESGLEHGEKAAKYALEILNGTPIESLPVRKANVGIKMINRETADYLKIQLTDSITSDAIVIP